MYYTGKSKIGKQHSKPTITYPVIRLPLQCSEAIGNSVQIFKSKHAGQTVLVVIPDIEKSESLRQEVAQPTSKVAQLETETNVESRLSSIESSINELKQLFFQNNELFDEQSPKEDGLDRIRTGDLRRVKVRNSLNSFELSGISSQSLLEPEINENLN